jgi:hypothetical protein
VSRWRQSSRRRRGGWRPCSALDFCPRWPPSLFPTNRANARLLHVCCSPLAPPNKQHTGIGVDELVKRGYLDKCKQVCVVSAGRHAKEQEMQGATCMFVFSQISMYVGLVLLLPLVHHAGPTLLAGHGRQPAVHRHRRHRSVAAHSTRCVC